MSLKVCNKCGVRKEESEFYKRYAKCKDCMKQEKRESYLKNKDKLIAQAKERYRENKEKICEARRIRRAENPEAARAYSRAQYQKHRGKALANKARHYRDNKDVKEAYDKSRRHIKNLQRNSFRAGKAMPDWLSASQIKDMEMIYKKAREMNVECGERKFAVDHIVPINGKNVSGLHVPWNLQILTFSENSSKGNRT